MTLHQPSKNEARLILDDCEKKLSALFGREIRVTFADTTMTQAERESLQLERIITAAGVVYRLTTFDIKRPYEYTPTDVTDCICTIVRVLKDSFPDMKLAKVAENMGRTHGGRHSTARYWLKRFSDLYDSDPQFGQKYRQILELLEGKQGKTN